MRGITMKMKQILTLALVLALCLSLAACGGEEGPQLAAGEALYKVSVTDALGNPYTAGVIVQFMQNGQQVAMQVVNEQGVAEKALPKGDYSVELKFTDNKANYYFDAEAAKLSEKENALTVVLYTAPGEATDLFAYSLKAGQKVDCQAYHVSAGCTWLELTVDERNYFLFTPVQAGTYDIYLESGEGTVGYYGSPYFVQDATAAEVVDGKLTISVSASMIGTNDTGTSVFVLGVDAKSDKAVLAVERTGDAQKTVSDEPWTPYVTTHTPTPYTLPAGSKLTYVDIFKGKTEDYKLVMGNDGFYHLGTADGPLMYINLGKEAPNLSLQIMIQGDGLAGGAPMRKYFYDENGEFLKKEDYTEIVVSYIENADQEYMVYPLTADMEYILKNGGAGWWDATHPNYIFDGCNPEIGWLFACCYVK